MSDELYMRLAIELAKKDQYPYGAVIVRDNEVIGRSDVNVPVAESGFSHAELRAIEDAMDKLGGHLCAEGGHGATIYCSCEPCAMCMGAILYAGISRVVYGATLEDSAECVNEILAHAEDVAKVCRNRKVEIVPKALYDEAKEVLDEWKSDGGIGL